MKVNLQSKAIVEGMTYLNIIVTDDNLYPMSVQDFDIFRGLGLLKNRDINETHHSTINEEPFAEAISR